jgi:hypothetical protein
MSIVRLILISILIVMLCAVGVVIAQDPIPSAESLEGVLQGKPYSPYAGKGFPSQAYFGDTHLHTGYSMDAGAFGARLDPSDAYRFAKGEELVASTGQRVKLSRPLDFLVVADHSDNMGFFPRLLAGEPELLSDPTGRDWYDRMQLGGQDAVSVAVDIIVAFSQNTFPPALESRPGEPAFRSAWDVAIDAADEANDPGTFTAFIGYEWTSNTGGNNLHRVVILKDDGMRASQVLPYTTLKPEGSDNPRDLWNWLGEYEDKTGGQVLAIAHNGNLSNGIMFPWIESFTGKRIDKEYAETRARWEPLYEVTQIKGDGEAHPFLSPNDEFADYETWDQGNLDLSTLKEDDMLQYEYGRSGLKLGLKVEDKLGTNPYKFGLIGSTDSHTGLATAQEDNFFGKHTGCEPSEGRVHHPMAKIGDVEYPGWSMVASGLAGVWARENTREAIFDAMKRKETFATTGSRMLVRFFGGWDFEPGDAETRSPAFAGYRKGVPMGGDLPVTTESGSPNFLVAALKDPLGANLDRIQIVKGWMDDSGELHERIYDVVVSDDRAINAEGRCTTPVGNTVDVANANWTNTIGDPELLAYWQDPDFDASQRAFYYARVLEIPTPRWTAYDAKYYNMEVPEASPMTTQERAYTSPIWYTPAK